MNKSLNTNNWNFYRVGTWGAILIMTYFLLTEHRAHVIQFLPYLFLIACPLMHIFMHRGHNHHSGHESHSNADKETK
jgi:hypothetical protein